MNDPQPTAMTDDLSSPMSDAPCASPSHDETLPLKSRHVMIFGAITEELAYATTQRLVALDVDRRAPINVFVCSPGGHLESGDTIHDVLRFIKSPVNMIGTGWVGSAATHLYLAIPRERRYCLPNTRFLIHQPSGGARGRASDIALQAREILRARERIARTIAAQTSRSLQAVLADIERDRWLAAEDAVAYGLVARIISRETDL